jgi:uncharacterized protein (TIGR04255 family)
VQQEREISPVPKAFPQPELDEVFPRPPLREVAFEIRFAPRLRVNAELWKIQDEIVEEYPALSMEQVVQASGTLLPVNVFQNPNAARAIKISQENFVVAFTRYTRFEDFKAEVIAKTKRFCEKFDISTVSRTGLRYVNNFIVPGSGKTSEILRYVRPVVDFDRLDADEIQHFVTEVRMRQRGHLVTLRGALLAPLEGGQRVYVLDVDCHNSEPHSSRDIPKLLDTYHETAQLFFLDHVTEEYKNIMRGKS